ncbi:MAG: putative photosynthetic complex assembly protein PuhE [Pseudomonadota bacterium]
MAELLLPPLFALLLWWTSTGVLLLLVRAPRRTYVWSMGAMGVLLVAALYGAQWVSHYARSPGDAYLAIVFGVSVWAWHELSYLMGFLTGPRKTACPPGAAPLKRFRLAIGTTLYHELAVIACGLSLVLLTWGQPNRVALWVYLVLWVMRWSAKLNMFLGVRNFNEEWFPEHLHFLVSYLQRRRFNWLFPWSVTISSVIAGMILVRAVGAEDVFTRSASALVFAMLLLAIVEHWMLMLPLRSAVLWKWFTESEVDRRARRAAGVPLAVGSGSKP